MSDVAAIVQARMSSRRFPGKVLAPFKGRPVLEHVLRAVEQAVPPEAVLIATSAEPSDDPIADFAGRRRTRVVRGDLANVLARLQQAAQTMAAEWILRINADSPLHDPAVLQRVMAAAGPQCDLVTTIQPRTFPKGRNAELIRRTALLGVDAASATAEEQEHVTRYFYNRPQTYRIQNVSSGHADWARESLAVDTADDLARLERMSARDLARFALDPPHDAKSASRGPRAATVKLGVAVVGLGVGEAHARAYHELPSCELRWVADLDAARAEAAAQTYRCQATTSFQAVLDDPAVQIVSLASYDDAHAEQAIAALERGKHVFVEKPLARTVGELTAVKQAWRRGASHLASNLILRAAPLYARVREMISSGELGDVYAFDGDYLYGRIEKITDGWRAGVADYSVIEGGGIHLVDLMVWLTGQRPSTVATVGNRIATRGTAFSYDDFAAATYQFRSGLIGRITANFGCMHRHHHVVRVFGTRATFIYDDRGARLHTSREPDSHAMPIDLAPLASSKGDLVPAFVNGILSGDRDAAATQTHFDVLSACAAADRAAGAGKFLEIDYV